MKTTENVNFDAPFQSIRNAAIITGLSSFYIRKGCREGTIKHIKSGNTYFVNVPALLASLGVEE